MMFLLMACAITIMRRTEWNVYSGCSLTAALWMLEQSAGACVDLESIARIKVHFARFILVGQNVSVWLAAKDHKSAKIEARVDDQAVIVMTLGFGSRAADASAPAAPISS